MATPKVYVFCDQNCKFEGMTKEQILTAIVQAVSEGTIGDIDTGFITTIKTINGLPLKFFVGEQSAYDELTADEKNNLFAIITNDKTKAELLLALEEVQNAYNELTEGLANGSIVPAVIAAQKLTPDSWTVAIESDLLKINKLSSEDEQTTYPVPFEAGKTYLLKLEGVLGNVTTQTVCYTSIISIMEGEGVESYAQFGGINANLAGYYDVAIKYKDGLVWFVGTDGNDLTDNYGHIKNGKLKYRELF